MGVHGPTRQIGIVMIDAGNSQMAILTGHGSLSHVLPWLGSCSARGPGTGDRGSGVEPRRGLPKGDAEHHGFLGTREWSSGPAPVRHCVLCESRAVAAINVMMAGVACLWIIHDCANVMLPGCWICCLQRVEMVGEWASNLQTSAGGGTVGGRLQSVQVFCNRVCIHHIPGSRDLRQGIEESGSLGHPWIWSHGTAAAVPHHAHAEEARASFPACHPHHPWTTAGTRPFGKKLLGSRHSNPTLRPNMTRRSRCAPFYTIERVRYPRPFSHWMNVTKMMARFARSCHSPAPLTT